MVVKALRGEWSQGVTANRHGGSFYIMEMFWNWCDGLYTLWLYTKNCWIVYFKKMSFMICKFYLNKPVIKNKKEYDSHGE